MRRWRLYEGLSKKLMDETFCEPAFSGADVVAGVAGDHVASGESGRFEDHQGRSRA